MSIELSDDERQVWLNVYWRYYYYAAGSIDIVRWGIIYADAAVIHMRSALTRGIGRRVDDAKRPARQDIVVTAKHREAAWRFFNEASSLEMRTWIEHGVSFDLRHEEAAVSFAEAECIATGEFELFSRPE